MKILSTARESERSLQTLINCSLVDPDPVSLSSFINTRIPHQEVLQVRPNSSHILGGSGSARKSLTSVEKLLHLILGFGSHMQEGPLISRQGTVISSYRRHKQNKIRGLRDQLNSAEAAHYDLRH